MKKLLVVSAYLLITGLSLLLIGFTVAGTFAGQGMGVEMVFLGLGSLTACFSIAVVPSALKSLD